MKTKTKPGGASEEAIQFHYDVSNAFYELWLDPTMSYSSALYEEGDSLERAQLRKIDHHINESGAANANRLLDIGCGWGAVLKRGVQEHGVKTAHGLTLSKKQHDWVTSLDLEQVQVSLKSWQDFEPDEPYDAIISVGAFEHFGKLDQSNEEKIANYRSFFHRCRDWLKPGGRMSLQTFAYGTSRDRADAKDSDGTQFLARDIFPETDPPRFSDIALALDGVLEIERLRNDRLHYAKTCREWITRMAAHKDELTELVGPEVVSRYQEYLKLSVIGFHVGYLDLHRITLRRTS